MKVTETIDQDDGGVVGSTMRRLTTNDYDKPSSLHVEFTPGKDSGDSDDGNSKYDKNGKKKKKKKKKKGEEGEEEVKKEELPTVGFFSLFRFATGTDKFLLFIGLLGGIVTGLCAPANTLLFGNLTGAMVGYGSADFDPTNLTAMQIIQDEFLSQINSFAINNSIIGAVMLTCSYLSVMLFNHAAQKQILLIRNKFFKSALHQDIGWYDLNQSGEFASRMAEDLAKLEEGIGEKVVMFVHFQISFVGSLVLAFVKGWELALICLCSLPVTMIAVGLVSIVTARLSKKELGAYGKAGSIAEEVLSSIRTVMAFGGQTKEVERYQENLIYAKRNNIKRGFFSGLGFGLLWFFIYSSYALAFWYGVGLVLEQKDWPDPDYDAATMVTVFFSVMMGSMNFGISSPYFETFAIAKGAGSKVFSVIKRISPINSNSDEGTKPDDVKGSIRFNGVHFNYPSRQDVKILKGLDLTINRGETVALVGSSGCGKSTVVQLVQRFYDPLDGTVELDGVDVKELNVAWLRSRIGVVGQEPILFAMTIAENIRYGLESASLDDIKEAAKEANAHDFIMKLPLEYETLVGERGAQMSGGQKQRIAIARALIRKPVILLLDEATSALDTGSEARVQQALDKASLGRTTIIVAHRLSTIRHAHKIVVISDGQVVEQGTHDELMAIGGHYHSLVMAQVTHGEDEETGEDKDDDNVVVANPKKLSRLMSITSKASDVSSIDDVGVVHTHDIIEETIPEVPLRRIMAKNKQEWPFIMIGCIASIIMGCAMPIFAVLFGDILGILSLPDPAQVRSETNIYCVYFVIAGVAVGFATFLQIYSFGVAGENLTLRLRGLAFASMVRQEVAWFDDKSNSTGSLCARLSGDAASVQGATGQRIGTILQSLATLFLGVGLSLSYEWRLGLVALAFTPIILIANYAFAGAIRGESLNNQAAMERSTKLAVEAVGNIRTVVSLGREQTFHDQYIAELMPAHKVAQRNNHLRGIVFGLARSIMFFAFATCMYYGGQLVVNDGLPYATVFKVSQALIMGTVSIANAIAFAPNFSKGLQAASKIFALLDRKPKIYDPLHPIPGSDKWIAEGHVNYSGVEFFYETRSSTKVLRGLNLVVKPGQTIALVGQSGCGKSTCVQLLERFYDPTAGVVSLDEKDISAVKLMSLRAQLGIVSQEPILFDRTIAENIAYGDNTRKVKMDEIISAAKNANIHNFIASLPLGYETRMGEKGAQLSGGQKQRVAIARALIRNPRILLLDEATSALDTESEKVVQEALDKAKEGRTCITIAHRLSTIQDADVICVISKGKVAEMGKHGQLLAQRGLYYKLYSLQGGQK